MLNGEDVDDVTIGLDWTFGSAKLNTPNIKNSGTLTLPTSTDTLVGRATTDTLTNKTLTLPVISAVSNSGTVTFPAATTTLVGRDTTDTLTNKTLTAPVIATITNVGSLTLPTSSDTLIGRDTTDTLTNKTLDSTNTISSATSLPIVTVAKGGTGQATATLGFDALSPMTTAGDIIIGGASGTRTRLGIGTANQLLRTNSGATAPEWASTLSGLTLTAPVIATISNSGTITIPTGTLTLATLTGSETLTNKTLTTPIISTISNTGTVTLPTASDTLVGRATTDTLTNKTIDTKLNTISNSTGIHPSVKRTGSYTGTGNGAAANMGTTGILDNMGVSIAVGAGGVGFSSFVRSSGGLGARGIWTTGTNINGIGGLKFSTSTLQPFERSISPMIEARLAPRTALTTERVFFGFHSSTAAPTSLASPLDSLSGVAFFYDSAVDGNWHIHQNDGTATALTSAVANVAAAATTPHIFALRATGDTKFQYQYDGGGWVDIPTSQIPASTTGLGMSWYIEALAGSAARALDVYWAYCEIDGGP